MSSEEEFAAGEDIGADPWQAAVQSGGRVRTTLTSTWLRTTCSVCGHTFRRDDYVQVASDRTVRHDMPGLRCAGEGTTEPPPDGQCVAEFLEGIKKGRYQEGEYQLPVTHLHSGHPLLVASIGTYRPHRCVMCQHTFRLNDEVVICPCGRDPEHCLAAVHQDLSSGLVCLDEWMPGASSGEAQLKICPVTNEKINQPQ